jgi:thiamine pyrophosphate-dependent acetolactate synthase large subunit-like protein
MARDGSSVARTFYGNRFSNSYMRNGMPNFADVAKAYGISGLSSQ